MIFEKLGKVIRIHCPAKLNLYLEVTGKRSDNYHNLEGIFQEIALYDRLQIEIHGREGIQLLCADPNVPRGGDNLIVRAARKFLEKYKLQVGLKIQLDKTIPTAGGLGGGSSNGAATLIALNELFHLRLSVDDLAAEAAKIGSDCPFFIYGKTAICRGRGELVETIDPLPKYGVLLICPSLFTPTAAVYRSLIPPSQEEIGQVDLILEQLRSGSIERVRSALFNRLEKAAFDHQPELAAFREKLLSLNLPKPILTGSGSAFYSLYATVKEAEDQRALLEQQLAGEHRGVFTTSFCEGA